MREIRKASHGTASENSVCFSPYVVAPGERSKPKATHQFVKRMHYERLLSSELTTLIARIFAVAEA